ncbi:hypothetical protein V8D89_015044 [Ganoderma adspersum]
MPPRSATPKKALASRHRSTAPSPSCKPQSQSQSQPQPQPPQRLERPADESCWDDISRILYGLPDTWNRHTKAFATLAGAVTLNESELRALQPVPRPHNRTSDADADEEEEEAGERRRRRPATRSQAALGQKVEFALRASRKAYLRKYGVPMCALLGATEDALRGAVVGGGARSVASMNVSLRRVRIRIVWPQPATMASRTAVYEEWVRIDESTTKVQLGMLVAKVFFGFLEEKTAALSQEETFEWRLRPDALYRTWLVGLERVETNLFVAYLRYALNDP